MRECFELGRERRCNMRKVMPCLKWFLLELGKRKKEKEREVRLYAFN